MGSFLRQDDKFAEVVCGCCLWMLFADVVCGSCLRMLFVDLVWGIGCKVVARIG